jgi:hypothetical protein
MRRSLAFLLVLLATSACKLSTTPTVTAKEIVPAIVTVRPDIWDTREELSAWVNNQTSQGSTTVVGTGTDAVIQVNITQTDALLRGPDFDPPATIAAGRVRYRWLDPSENEVVFVWMHLRPPSFDSRLSVPRLHRIPDHEALRAEQWIESTLETHIASSRGPFTAQFPTLSIRGSGVYRPTRIHGTIEIDWIGVVRP